MAWLWIIEIVLRFTLTCTWASEKLFCRKYFFMLDKMFWDWILMWNYGRMLQPRPRFIKVFLITRKISCFIEQGTSWAFCLFFFLIKKSILHFSSSKVSIFSNLQIRRYRKRVWIFSFLVNYRFFEIPDTEGAWTRSKSTIPLLYIWSARRVILRSLNWCSNSLLSKLRPLSLCWINKITHPCTSNFVRSKAFSLQMFQRFFLNSSDNLQF